MKPKFDPKKIVVEDVEHPGIDSPPEWWIHFGGKIIAKIEQSEFTIFDMIDVLNRLGIDTEMKRPELRIK